MTPLDEPRCRIPASSMETRRSLRCVELPLDWYSVSPTIMSKLKMGNTQSHMTFGEGDLNMVPVSLISANFAF